MHEGCPKSLSNSQRLPVKICNFAAHCRRSALRQREVTASLLAWLGPEEGYLHGTAVCMAGSCNATVRFGSLSSWVCSWQVLAKRQWKAMQLSAEHVYQQTFWSSGCARGGAEGALGCAAHVCASAPLSHMETWCSLRAAPQT